VSGLIISSCVLNLSSGLALPVTIVLAVDNAMERAKRRLGKYQKGSTHHPVNVRTNSKGTTTTKDRIDE
jgi:hypothetical protein